MQSIWAFDRDGRPLVSSTIPAGAPGPEQLRRDYFRAHVTADAGTFIGDIVQARVGSARFFVVSGRRPERPDGSFNGVIGITVLPEHFREFYGRLARGVADSFGLLRGMARSRPIPAGRRPGRSASTRKAASSRQSRAGPNGASTR
jgi:two-component system NtrC family sensor kinase